MTSRSLDTARQFLDGWSATRDGNQARLMTEDGHDMNHERLPVLYHRSIIVLVLVIVSRCGQVHVDAGGTPPPRRYRSTRVRFVDLLTCRWLQLQRERLSDQSHEHLSKISSSMGVMLGSLGLAIHHKPQRR